MAQPQPDDQFRAYLAALIALYVQAEQNLLGGISAILRFTTPDMISQLMALRKMRRLVERTNRELTAGDAAYARPLLNAALTAGSRDAQKQLARLGTDIVPRPLPFDFSIPHGVRSLNAIRADLLSPLEDVRRRITRLPDDVYKLISPAAAGGQVLGHGYTPSQAQAYAWRAFVRNGVTGFTDRAGRDWSLSAYVEMSVRTATMRAYNDSHLQVMTAAGIDLYTVDDDGHPCPLCFPWQNKILSVDPDPRADATIAEATAAGLFHPNCKHVLNAYIPAYSKVKTPREWTDEDAAKYKLTQKQRRLELDIRKAKKQQEYAISPSTRADARADVRAAQARMRQFIDESGLLRHSRREQVDLADSYLKLPA
ncbi:MAG TPA: phage minor capsid protein [Galbitalea sp.]|jgi:hypothetical protein